MELPCQMVSVSSRRKRSPRECLSQRDFLQKSQSNSQLQWCLDQVLLQERNFPSDPAEQALAGCRITTEPRAKAPRGPSRNTLWRVLVLWVDFKPDSISSFRMQEVNFNSQRTLFRPRSEALAPGIGAMRAGAGLTRAISEGGILPGVDQAAASRAVREGVAGGGAAVTPRMSLLDKEDSIGQMASMASNRESRGPYCSCPPAAGSTS